MPADLLTLGATRIATAVEAVLAGAPIENTAAGLGVDPADLADIVEAYRAAGLAAVRRRQEGVWFQARLALPDWKTAESTFAHQVAPRLDQVDGGHAAWWFLRKHPHWRIRIRTGDRHAVEVLLDELTATGAIDHWRPGIYEPEAAAFGHATAMEVVHELFCADSQGVLTYARQDAPQIGRRELSLFLIRALQQHAGLDWFEAGDVFDRITQMRPTPSGTHVARVDSLASRLRHLLTIPVQPDSTLFASGGPVAFANPWLTAFAQAGRSLGAAAASGQLDRGLRAVLAQIVIFHWNRLDLSAAAQGVLAQAAKNAILARS